MIQTSQVYSQSLGGIDLTSVKVDDLTDQQILNYISQAEERGISQVQLEALARQRGVSESEISKLRARVDTLRSGINKISMDGGSTGEGKVSPKMQLGDEDFESFSEGVNKELTDEQKQIFGFDLFNQGGLTFAPNLSLPTPLDYQLGPGDAIIVDLWGATEQFMTYEVSSEGTIRLQNVGPIYINGLTIEKATERIISRLSQIYDGLNKTDQASPSIFYQVRLGNIRTINIDVIGNVGRPGPYALPSLATVYTALHAAGGPTEEGTFRNIRLVRNNKLISTIDIYSFLTNGIRSGDERLRNGDVIIVDSFVKRTELVGEVRKPGLFELKKTESLEFLLDLAKGFSNSAFKSLITVKRKGSREHEILDVPATEFATFIPEDGDVIEVGAILDRFSNRVVIDGAVFREGEYELIEGLTLKQMIEKAGGLRGDAFLGRATIFRTNSDYSKSTIPVNLRALMDGTSSDLPLVSDDVIRITSIYDLNEEYYVQISGEVLEAGTYPFFNQMTVQDLIILSGGLKESASGALIEISRRNKSSSLNSAAQIITLSIDKTLLLDDKGNEVVMEPFDQVYVRRSPGYSTQQQVRIEGEVLAPGIYTLGRKDERISDILKRAKGLTPYAYPEGAILVRRTEFEDRESNDVISQEYLQGLRQRALSQESQLKNTSRDFLLERLEQIGKRTETNPLNDKIGSEIKKNLIEDLAERDSLIRDVEIQETEPVALDLDKILESPGSKYDMILRPGDVISIPGKLETVRVTGEISSALNIRYDESFSFKDYIHQSGGFLATAKRGRSYVLYPNGERQGVKRFLWFKKYPKVEPGSTIFVSQKPERKGLTAQGWVSIGTGLATWGLVIVQAIDILNR